jgi:hypothetical protein
MPLPTDTSTCTFFGAFVRSDGTNTGIEGTMQFVPRPKRALDYANNIVILPETVTGYVHNGVLYRDQAFTIPGVVVLAGDDPDVSPIGWTYQVFENFVGGWASGYDVEAPSGGTVQIAQVSPVPDAQGNPIVRGPKGDAGSVTAVLGESPDLSGDVDISSLVLLRAQNLADLPDPASARTNLGVGASGTHPDTFFVTPAQALLKSNNLTDLIDPPTARTALNVYSVADIDAARFLHWMAHDTAGAVIPSDGFNFYKIAMAAAVLDPNGWGVASSGLVCPMTGVWKLGGKVFYPDHTNNSRAAAIGINTVIQTASVVTQNNVGPGQIQVACWDIDIHLTAGDVVTLWGLQNSGTSLTTTPGGSYIRAEWRSL